MIRRSSAIALGIGVALVVAILSFAGGMVVALRWGNTLPLNVATNQTASAQRTTPSDLQADFGVFWEVWNLVDRKFYTTEPLDQRQMIYGAITGMLRSLGDDYTVFEDPDTAAHTRERIAGQFEGIGAYVDYVDSALTIVSPIEESPAAKAGLLAGDIVVRVDNNELAPLLHGLDRNEATRKAVSLIRGPKGSTVQLTILRPSTNETLEFNIVRDAVPLISVRHRMLDGNIAHIQLSEFRETTAGELDRALNEVLSQEPSGIILDLRNNPGGLLTSAQEVLGRFVPDGAALIEEFGDGRTETIPIRRTAGVPSVFDIPMVVLINQGSASASEIVAGALRDHERATLVGDQTFGKGSVQSVDRLSDGSLARITIAHWFTPNRTEIHQKGIAPDAYVPFLEDEQYRVELPQGRPTDPTEVNDSQLWWAIRMLTTAEQPAFPTPTPTTVGVEPLLEETPTP